jgi:microcystin-dependent protein
MSCSNCFNGCPEIVSDKCVKYTGLDIPVLGIKNGDSLSYIEQSLAGFLVSCLDGTGIKPDLNVTGSSGISCELVSQYLPDCGDLTINDFIVALIKAACNLQNQIDDITDTLETLNADYSIECLEGVTVSSGTHAILQAVITKLCEVEGSVEALALILTTNYVAIADLNDYIQAYLDSISTNGYKNRMVPYTVVEYYGSLGVFNGAGVGTGLWDRIFLCNGQNGTPDKRGRVPVGAIVGVIGGGALNAAVDPGITGNPNYALFDVAGLNMITLASSQMPTHTHLFTPAVPTPHFHFGFGDVNSGTGPLTSTNYAQSSNTWSGGNTYNYEMGGSATVASVGKTSDASVTFSGLNASAGSGLSHANIQPVLACYYIMYIP